MIEINKYGLGSGYYNILACWSSIRITFGFMDSASRCRWVRIISVCTSLLLWCSLQV